MTKGIRCIPALLWMGVIYWLSDRPSVQSAIQSEGLSLKIVRFISGFIYISEEKQYDTAMLMEPYLRDAAHALEYAVLFVLIMIAVRGFTGDCRRAAMASLLICFLYACSDEVHQRYVPGRAFQLVDILLDTAGAAVPATVFMLTSRHIRRKKR
ncbi:MAG: VanZ family protein [Lachnospiraceae bacterium]|nr:VanZ family protein [Lachnospiraceae bacterium]MCR4786808.1 VanZ family protein [Lachnospiraceae bacterium]